MPLATTLHNPAFTARRTAPTFNPLRIASHCLAVWQQRRTLATLDDARLADLGLTREAALREARQPFWNVPKGW